MLRKLVVFVKCCGGRKHRITILLLWITTCLLVLSWLSEETGKALLPPPPPDQDLNHFRRSRSLEHYLNNIEVLVEPSSVCEDIPRHSSLLVLVSSAPHHAEHRAAIRQTWGKHQPTYFVIGINPEAEDSLVDNYVEAKHHSDLIVFDLLDHYQNLTLKTGLMLEWTTRRCPNAGYLFKTDDDVVMNPYTMGDVVEQHDGAALIGYSKNGSRLHRDEYTKWFVPRWLVADDSVPHYLSGTGYLIQGYHIPKILEAAKQTPLINLEDVYMTYLVANSKLGLALAHDSRLSPYKPWLPLACAHWSLASSHSFTPDGIRQAWRMIEDVASDKGTDVCAFFKKHLESEWFLY